MLARSVLIVNYQIKDGKGNKSNCLLTMTVHLHFEWHPFFFHFLFCPDRGLTLETPAFQIVALQQLSHLCQHEVIFNYNIDFTSSCHYTADSIGTSLFIHVPSSTLLAEKTLFNHLWVSENVGRSCASQLQPRNYFSGSY